MLRLVDQKGVGKPYAREGLRDREANSHRYCTVDEGNSQPSALRGANQKRVARDLGEIKTRTLSKTGTMGNPQALVVGCEKGRATHRRESKAPGAKPAPGAPGRHKRYRFLSKSGHDPSAFFSTIREVASNTSWSPTTSNRIASKATKSPIPTPELHLIRAKGSV
jgi:hypothetical protein